MYHKETIMAPVKKATTPAAPVADAKKPVKTVDLPTATEPAAEPATKTAPKKKAAAPVAVTAGVTAPVAEAPAEEKKDESSEDKSGENLISSVVEKVGALAGQIKDIQAALKLLVKEHEKQQKIIEKVQKKRENARKSPSGFAKPNKISNELCDFIGVPHGTEKSRTEVTRFINAYVKEHNLNNPTNRRVIIPDAKLKSILNIKEGEDVTFFILQRLISHHFPLSISKMNAAAVAAA